VFQLFVRATVLVGYMLVNPSWPACPLGFFDGEVLSRHASNVPRLGMVTQQSKVSNLRHLTGAVVPYPPKELFQSEDGKSPFRAPMRLARGRIGS
jgi:hypothetical protein